MPCGPDLGDHNIIVMAVADAEDVGGHAVARALLSNLDGEI